MKERISLMNDYLAGHWGLAALARRYGLSRKTVYKWIERFKQEQWNGLEDRSRAPKNQPRAVRQEIIDRIVEIKAQWPLWGAPRIHQRLRQEFAGKDCPSASSVSNIMRRLGLTRPARKILTPVPETPPLRGLAANDIWHATLKEGQPLGDGSLFALLIITDAATRFVLVLRCMNRVSTGESLMMAILERTFREFGVPSAIHADNSPPFFGPDPGQLNALSVWLLKHGIKLQHLQPTPSPEIGSFERMYQTLQQANGKALAVNHKRQQSLFDRYRRVFNHEHPNEGLESQVPASYYRSSERKWTDRNPRELEYPESWETLQVMHSGQIEWRGQKIENNPALARERLGLEPIKDGAWRIWFGSYVLGVFDERKEPATPLRTKGNLLSTRVK